MNGDRLCDTECEAAVIWKRTVETFFADVFNDNIQI